jgi:hypothetical protein
MDTKLDRELQADVDAMGTYEISRGSQTTGPIPYDQSPTDALGDETLEIRMLRSPRGGYITVSISENGQLVSLQTGSGEVVQSYWDRLVALAGKIRTASYNSPDREP